MTTMIPTQLPFATQALTQPQAPATGASDLQRSDAVARFEQALNAAAGQSEQIPAHPPVQLAQVSNVPPGQTAVVTDATAPLGSAQPVAASPSSADVDARARAAEGLDLARPELVQPTTEGTTILGGLEQLRGIFDSQFNSVGSKLEATQMDVTSMMALQAEVVKFTVMVDVSSKLAGKTTQAMDSLMKGQ